MAKKKAAAKKTLAVRGSTALAAPSYVEASQEGKDNFRAEDMQRPFLRLCQNNTPQVVEKKASAGDFINTVTGKVYGREVRFVAIAFQPSRMLFEKYDEGGGILCQAPDGHNALTAGGQDAKGKPTDKCAACVHSQWSEKKSGDQKPPACTEQANYLVLVEGEEQPAQLVIQNTSWKAHKKLASMINQSRYAIYAGLYSLTSREETGKVGSYLVLSVDAQGFPSEKDYKTAKALYESMAAKFTRRAA